MMYEVLLNSKKIEEIDIPKDITMDQFKKGFSNFYFRHYKTRTVTFEFEKLKLKETYLVSNREKLFVFRKKKMGFLDKLFYSFGIVW